MIYYLKDNAYEKEFLKNAGSKAREDCEKIFNNRGYLPILLNITSNPVDNCNALKKEFEKLKENDCVIFSIALYFSTIKIKDVLVNLKNRKIKIIIFVHDLNVIRRGFNYYEPWVRFPIPKHEVYNEEYEILYYANFIISHNYKMTKILKKSFFKCNVLTLNCFDYLSDYDNAIKINDKNKGIVIAGNLCREKSEYLYSLPKENNYFLYGVGFDDTFKQDNVSYCGSLFPNELIPNICKYSFGLIWDGISTKKCAGKYGNYSKVNNPHKLSLYLASGIPVIVWKKAAIAKFVTDNKIGICVNNLNEINDKIKKSNYEIIRNNAIKIGEKIRNGYFLNNCLGKLEELICFFKNNQ